MRLEATDLGFSYDDKRIFEHVTLAAQSSQVLCLLGANGAGKSTFLGCLAGHLRPNTGRVEIDGTPLLGLSAAERARHIAYIPQTQTTSFGYRCLDVVLMGRTAHLGYFASPSAGDEEEARGMLERLGVAKVAEQPFTAVSGGERQLVLIASALIQRARFLILDEPTSYLDFGNTHAFLDLLAQLNAEGVGIIMSTHFPDHVLYLHAQVASVQHGTIKMLGAADDVITPELLKQLYGVQARVVDLGDQRICAVDHRIEHTAPS